VSITGTVQLGNTLTANITDLGGSGTISYQWNSGGTPVTGANGSTYIVKFADIGSLIGVTVTRSENSGNISSNPTVAVPEPAVSITGAPIVGQTLTANISNIIGTVDYQWRRNGSVNIGSNSNTYILAAADAGSTITVSVSVSGDPPGGITGAPTGPVKLPDAFTVSFAEFQDLAPDITGPTIYLTGGEDRTVKYITVTNPGQYDSGSIKWYFNGNQITGPDVSGSMGETLKLSSAVYRNIGIYFVTVEVRVNGRLYSKAISFEVKL